MAYRSANANFTCLLLFSIFILLMLYTGYNKCHVLHFKLKPSIFRRLTSFSMIQAVQAACNISRLMMLILTQ